MTGIAFKIEKFFDYTLLNFDYNEMDYLSPLEETNEDVEIFIQFDALREENQNQQDEMFDTLLTPRLSLTDLLDLSFEDDRLPMFTDICSDDIFRPTPIYTLETQTSVR